MTMLPNVGVQVLATQKPMNRPGWWKVCFISDAGNRGGGGQMSVQRWTPPSTDNQGDKSFYRLREGAPGRNSTVNFNSHLDVSHAMV